MAQVQRLPLVSLIEIERTTICACLYAATVGKTGIVTQVRSFRRLAVPVPLPPVGCMLVYLDPPLYLNVTDTRMKLGGRGGGKRFLVLCLLTYSMRNHCYASPNVIVIAVALENKGPLIKTS